MPLKTRAIFFDIDGTLLSYRTHEVLPSTIEAFGKLHNKGILTFISSGRPMVLIPQMPIEIDGFITVNGGYCTVGDKVLLRNPINADDCRRWFRYAEENNVVTMWFTEKAMYINRVDDEVVRLQNQLGFKMPPIKPTGGSFVEDDKMSDIYQFIAMQPAEKDEKVLEKLSHCRMPRWHPAFTDVIPDNSSKAVGIESILNHLGIGREETMAFGDGANDIEMLEYVEVGVAMGNATERVKQHADEVTADADSDGIYLALRKMGII